MSLRHSAWPSAPNLRFVCLQRAHQQEYRRAMMGAAVHRFTTATIFVRRPDTVVIQLQGHPALGTAAGRSWHAGEHGEDLFPTEVSL